MEEDQQFCLRWNNHQSTLISVFDTLLENGTLVDCTLAAEGKFLKAHKVVLSACSPYFATLLSEQYDKHPIFILKDVKYQELRAMMDYMYRGEVNISQDQLAALLKAAESLQIKGLSDNRGGAGSGNSGGGSGKAGEPQKHSTTGHHVPGKMTNIGHIGAGYTLEQSKRARIGPSSIDSQDIGGSREGSSSPTSRRRKKIRRRSVDNVMGDNHENSNSSQNLQVNSSVTGPGAITTSIVPSGAVAQAASGNQIQTQTNKKTDNLSKLDQGISVSTINPTASATATVSELEHDDNSNKKEHNLQAIKKDKEVSGGAGSAVSSSDIVIEPKSEYDDGNEETVEDLTLDDEMALDELDQTAGPSHGGEGSSQGYAQWQVDRSHDESYMAQDVQQRDPQAEDLSITRIAGLTWNEWNARLAMPLVTSLREGKHPLLFPTDLTTEKQSNSNSSKSTIHEQSTSSSPDRKSPGFYSPNNSANCISSNALTSTPANSGGKSSSSSNSNNNNNHSCTNHKQSTSLINCSIGSGSNNSNNNNSKVNNNYSVKSEFKSSLDGTCSDNEQDAGTFDSKNASGLCNINNINLLSSLSAMSTFMNSAGVGSSSAHSLGSGNTSALGSNNSMSGGVGHPCPDCGRLYKLKSSLRNHQKWECGKEPQFKCPFCVYRAKQKMHIGRHMERMHKEKFIKFDEKIFAAAAEEAGVHLPPFLN